MDRRSTTNVWWILSLLASVVILIAVPPTNSLLDNHTLGLDNRATGAAIPPPPENDGGCPIKPQPEPRYYNSVTKGKLAAVL
jgi:hypothetical protein